MKKTKLFLPLMTLGLVLGMGMTACDKPANNQSGNQQSASGQSTSQMQRIKVTAPGGKKDIQLGETLQLTADPTEVTWTSSDEKVATVNNGLVTPVGYGEVTITAKKDGYNNGSITINVVRPAASATFDLTTAADHYSADGWWELPSAGGFGFAMQSVNGWNPISQQSSWGQSDDTGDTFIGGFGVGDKETIKFTASKADKAELLLNMGNSDAVTLSEVMTVKLNGTAISLANKELEEHPGQFGNDLVFDNVSLGNLDVAATNTLEFEFLKDTNIFLNEIAVYAKEATIALTNPAEKQQITVAANKLEVIEEQTVAIQTTVQGVAYTSVDETIATVNNAGVVTGVKMGKTNITVKKEGMYSVRVEITVNPKPVVGQIIVEAESAEELADIEPGSFNQGQPMIMQDGSGMGGNEVHSGGAYVTMFGGDSLTLTMKFQADSAKTMVLSVSGAAPMAYGGDASPFVFADSMAIKLNGTAVTPVADAQFPAPQGFSQTMTEVVIGDVSVKSGENTLLVEITGSVPSLDCFKLSVK